MNTHKSNVYFVLSLFIFSALFSCKKGENDPFISLKSRTARFSQEWVLKKVEGTETRPDESNQNAISYEISFDGETWTEKSSDTTISFTYALQYNFTKKSEYTKEETIGEITETESGAWAWLGKSKKDKLKNKQAVALTTLEIKGENSTIFEGASITPNTLLVLDRLSSKELVLIEELDVETKNGSSNKDLVYTFEKK